MFNDTDVNATGSVDVNIKYKLYIIVPIIWSTIIFLGLLGNGIIIYIILKRRLYKDSCTNCYIINVAIADLCFTLICVPVTMTAYIYEVWIFGAFMCSFQMLLMFSSVQAACLTLTAMTVDRYLAVLYPFKSLDYRTTKLALMTNIIIWIASFTLSFPYFLYYNQTGGEDGEPTYCAADFPLFEINLFGSERTLFINMEIVLTVYTVMISYVLPLTTIIFCYMRMIRRIYGKSNDLAEESKMLSFSASTAAVNGHLNIGSTGGGSVSAASGGGLRLNVNRNARISLDSFATRNRTNGEPSLASGTSNNPISMVTYKKNKRGGSVPIESLLMPISNASLTSSSGGPNSANKCIMAKGGDLNKSMEEFLDELDEMEDSRRPSTTNHESGSAASGSGVDTTSGGHNKARTDSQKSEVRWSGTNEDEEEEKRLLKKIPQTTTTTNNDQQQQQQVEFRSYNNPPLRRIYHSSARQNSTSYSTSSQQQNRRHNSCSSSSHRTRALSTSSGFAFGRSSNMSNVEAMRKQKQKILLLIATVSITFALTWLPAHFIQLWRVIFKDTFPYNEAVYIVKFMAHTLSYSNSFLNPLIYVFMGSRFRQHIHSEFSYLYDVFRCRSPQDRFHSNYHNNHHRRHRNKSKQLTTTADNSLNSSLTNINSTVIGNNNRVGQNKSAAVIAPRYASHFEPHDAFRKTELA